MATDLVSLDINPKFKKLLRPLSPDEYQRLEWAVLKDGIQDSIKYWPHDDKNWIVDGHNRFNIYSQYPSEIEDGYKADPMQFASEDEALEWIIENQLRRRNLNGNERVLYLGRLFEMRKKRRGGHHNSQEAGATAEQIATEQDVSPRSVTRAAEVVKAFDEADLELQKKFADGDITQVELLRTLKKKEEAKAEKKDKFHNDKTRAIAAIGERIRRTITALDNQGQDFIEVCKALKIDPATYAPALVNLTKKLKQELQQAEALTTIVFVGNLCPHSDKEIACTICGGLKYVTAAGLENLREHYGIEESKAKAA